MQRIKFTPSNRNILLAGTIATIALLVIFLVPSRTVIVNQRVCVFDDCNIELSVIKTQTGIPFTYYSTNPQSDLGKVQAENNFIVMSLIGDMLLTSTPLIFAILIIEYRHEKQKHKQHFKNNI